MPRGLRDELRQRKPFESLRQEASLSVIRTGAMLLDGVELALRPYGIGATQFNVLRILRGAAPDGLCRNELRDRLLTRMPDVTRLLDRMEEAQLVARARETDDRRMVRTRITEKGLRLLDEVDPIVDRGHRVFDALDDAQLRQLIDVLAAVRERL